MFCKLELSVSTANPKNSGAVPRPCTVPAIAQLSAPSIYRSHNCRDRKEGNCKSSSQVAPAFVTSEPSKEARAKDFITRQQSGSHCTTSGPAGQTEVLWAITEAVCQSRGRLYRENDSVSNAVGKPGHTQTGIFSGSKSSSSDQVESGPQPEERRRRRGRPPGLECWNKGLTMSASTREKMSVAQKARWKDPTLNLRALQSEKQKGKVPWNKGKSLSMEVRQKMSAAKRFSVYPGRMRSKMSQSHAGLTHSPETCALISQRLAGKPKSPEHRAAMAAGQRKRIAAAKLLSAARASTAQEDATAAATPAAPAPVHMPEDTDSNSRNSQSIPEASNLFTSSGSHSRSKKKASSRPAANEAVVEEFVGQLRQFRALQQELAPWTEAFKAEHGRKPRLDDVQLTRMEWLIVRFKEYMLTRDRLLSESQQLRARLEAGPKPTTGSYQEKMNANNATAATVSEGATRIAKALLYKHSKASAEAAAAPAAESTIESLQDGPQKILNGQFTASAERVVEPSAVELLSSLADAAAGIRSTAQPTPVNGLTQEWPEGAAATYPTAAQMPGREAGVLGEASNRKKTPSLEEVRGLPASVAAAPPRVRAAMLAAAQYRKKKSQGGGKGGSDAI